jgi:hypothetical protein
MRPVVRDFAERALWTGGQQFVAVLLTTSTTSGVIDLPWRISLSTAAGAMVVSLLTTALQYIPVLRRSVGKSFVLDLALRLTKTFIASFLGTVGAMQFDVLTFNWSNALDLAVVATVGALAKGFLAAGPGLANNPSTLQGSTYTQVYAPPALAGPAVS